MICISQSYGNKTYNCESVQVMNGLADAFKWVIHVYYKALCPDSQAYPDGFLQLYAIS